MVAEAIDEQGSERFGVVTRIARQVGIGTESLRNWVNQAETDRGTRAGTTTEDRARIAKLEKEVRELRRANEILKSAAVFFGAELDADRAGDRLHRRSPPSLRGVEPICAALQVAPSTYYGAKSRPPCRRRVLDEALKVDIARVYEANYRVYGARKVWCQLNREGIVVARCRVERLMRQMGMAGRVRGKARRWPATPLSPSTLASRSTSAIPTAHGSAARTRTPTGCCASTCPRALTSRSSARRTSTTLPGVSTTDRARPSET